tara:strand:- start:496 stop:627 length:132 start_codon:yes stop_codon:yes gene_type:complete
MPQIIKNNIAFSGCFSIYSIDDASARVSFLHEKTPINKSCKND